MRLVFRQHHAFALETPRDTVFKTVSRGPGFGSRSFPCESFSFAPSTQVFMENRNADTIQLDDRSSWIQLSFH
eukprot:COSAG06_NODE_18630_length_876_cov_2.194337_2_plen_72_part_01